MICAVFVMSVFYTPFSPSYVSYRSKADKNLTISSLSVVSVSDNMSGIYAGPIKSLLEEWIQSSHRWRHIPSPKNFPAFSPYTVQNNGISSLDLNPLASKSEADAFVIVGVIKNLKGLSLTVSLFLKTDGLLLLQEKVRNFDRFELKEVNNKVNHMFQRLMDRLPYRALILSRQGDSITVGLGHKDGVQKDQEFSVVQIVKTSRHPKFHFLVHVESEILGRVQLVKVDSTLSFGRILMEKEPHFIQRDSKIANFKMANFKFKNEEQRRREQKKEKKPHSLRKDEAFSSSRNP